MKDVIAAVVTPIKNHEIDEISLKNHLEFLQNNKIGAVLCGGTTGEFFSLGRKRRRNLLVLTQKHFNGKIIFNVSDVSLFDVKENIAFAQDSDIDGITIIPPFYLANAPIDGIINFLNEAISYSKLPCMLYNFTKHTQNKITHKILKSVPHAALKDSDKDETLIAHTPCYICGGDSMIFDFYNKGAKGVVSVMANYCPKPVVKIWNELQAGDFKAARKTQEEICEIAAHFRKDDQIARIKYALSNILKDYPQDVGLPLLPIDGNTKKELDKLCREKSLYIN